MKYSHITDSLAKEWNKNKKINPLTGHIIMSNSRKYNFYKKYYKNMMDKYNEKNKSITSVIAIDRVIGDYLDLPTLINISELYNAFAEDLEKRNFTGWEDIKEIHTQYHLDYKQLSLLYKNIDSNDLLYIILDENNINSFTIRNLDRIEISSEHFGRVNPELRIKIQLLRYNCILMFYKRQQREYIMNYGIRRNDSILGYIISLRTSDNYQPFLSKYMNKFIEISKNLSNIIYQI